MAPGVEALMYELGDDLAYWPGGVEADAISGIEIIFTGGPVRDEAMANGTRKVATAEVQVHVADVAVPRVKADIVVKDGASWRVMAILETVGGMHRLDCERVDRAVVGRGRGAR